MRNAIGNALLVNIIIVFIVVMLGFLTGSLNYTKAYRIKNNLLNLIEREGTWNDDVKAEAEKLFGEIGYRVVKNTSSKCVDRKGGGEIVAGSAAGTYRYCVFKYTKVDNINGFYVTNYVVTTYMYFDIPLVSSILEFPVYGQTKNLYSKK